MFLLSFLLLFIFRFLFIYLFLFCFILFYFPFCIGLKAQALFMPIFLQALHKAQSQLFFWVHFMSNFGPKQAHDKPYSSCGLGPTMANVIPRIALHSRGHPRRLLRAVSCSSNLRVTSCTTLLHGFSSPASTQTPSLSPC